MKLVSRKIYKATAAQLWLIVGNPGNMPAWNPKCIKCHCPPQISLGSRFEATFIMRKTKQHAIGEVLHYKDNEQITFRYHYAQENKMGMVDESFRLEQKDLSSTQLTHTVDFKNAALPYWLKLLIGVMGHFGRKRGPNALDNIEALIQSPEPKRHRLSPPA